jgi:hypothetical protein
MPHEQEKELGIAIVYAGYFENGGVSLFPDFA